MKLISGYVQISANTFELLLIVCSSGSYRNIGKSVKKKHARTNVGMVKIIMVLTDEAEDNKY